MLRRRCFAAFWLTAACAAAYAFNESSEAQCLHDAIALHRRGFVPSLSGRNSSVGMVSYDWDSSKLVTNIAAILVREALGIHSQVSADVAVDVTDGIWLLSECLDTEGTECVSEHNYVALESWLGSSPTGYAAFQKANPELAPEDLGSIGYAGEEYLFLTASVQDAAYRDSGLALEFYKSYNTSFHNPKKYFDHVTDLSLADLVPCNRTDLEFNNGPLMAMYAHWTGDLEGVSWVNESDEGHFVATCPDGYFWISPACRHNTSACIPVLSAGNGWRINAFMQWWPGQKLAQIISDHLVRMPATSATVAETLALFLVRGPNSE